MVFPVELPGAGDDVKDALGRSPGHKGPACAVPDAAQQEDEDEVRIHAGPSLPVSAERDVYILPKKAAQGDVPPSPEIDDVNRLIRGIEVHRNLHAEQPRQAAGHVAVAAEIEIKLNGVKENEQQAVHRGQGRDIGISPVHRKAEGIRHKDLFHHTQSKQINTGGEFFQIQLLFSNLRKLGQHLRLAHDGSGDQLGEKGNEERIVQEGTVLHLSPVGIHHEADLLEGEKADSQREQNALQHKGGAKSRVHVFHKEIIIFKIEQHGQIGRHSENHHEPAPFWSFFPHQFHSSENHVVKQNTAYHDQQIAGIKVSVKPQRKACQPQSGRHAFSPVCKQIKTSEAEGKKQKDKYIGIKQHGSAPNMIF